MGVAVFLGVLVAMTIGVLVGVINNWVIWSAAVT